ncbi:ATP-binding protein [Gardnerella piotii]|uniref:ATP-binding protein n=1 Tax=Gardnerella piotii TaxID=2792977 RepID=UPI003CE58989
MIYNSATHALINRPEYLNQLIEHKDVDLVKIVTGIRRCGKSSLLDLFHKHLLNSGVSEDHIIHINLESLKYRNITNYTELYDYISKRIPSDCMEDGKLCVTSQNATESRNASKSTKTYLIFDELQAVEDWQKAVESFRIDFNVDIYITGSNAYLLSSEFSTLLAGRYVEIRMLPLSFKEFLNFYNFPTSASTDEKFQKYLQFGGMPVLSEYKFNEARSMQALEGIYSTVILRDVLQRNEKADQIVLQKLMTFLCSTIGSTTSPNSISKSLRAEGDIEKTTVSVASKTVSDYIRMLNNAFIVYPVQRYDVQGKELLKTLGKNYVIDLGFRNMLLGYRGTDRGHIIENVVFLELLRRDYRVYIGKVGNAEVDFVAEKPNEKIYVQVTESMQSPETRERELKPLRAIKDNYEKIVISMDHDYINSYDGIKAINLTDWLLK